METGRPLALKRERALSIPRARRFDAQAQVVLDIDPFHLVEPFTYGIPDELRESISVGSIVRVPFRTAIVDGYVTALASEPGLSVKPIVGLPEFLPIPEELLETATEVAARYATRLVDILSAVPRLPGRKRKSSDVGTGGIRYHITVRNPYQDALAAVSNTGRSLIVVATERELDRVTQLAAAKVSKQVVRVGTQGSVKSRRSALATISNEENCLVIGARSAILLPVSFREVLIVGELSSHYWEQRAPYWNLRDVALIRAQKARFNLTFFGPTPSLELQRLIDANYIERVGATNAKPANTFTFEPDTFHKVVRQGLQSGVVLISVADKAYSNAFCCERCRSLPRCDCGGRIIMRSDSEFVCSLCAALKREWRCAECGGNQRRLLRKGVTRIGTELGKAFPNTPILIASGETPIVPENVTGIIVATPGAEPLNIPFTGLALLDGDALIARGGLRGEEMLRGHWQRLLGLANPQAQVFVSLLANHRISQALVSGNYERVLRSEAIERNDLALPPSRRMVSIEGVERDLLALTKEFRAQSPNSIFSSVLKIDGERAVLKVRFDHDKGRDLASALFALQRYRSSTRRDLFTIKFDPLII